MATYHIEANQSALIVGPAKITLVAADAPVLGEVEAPGTSSLSPTSAVAGDPTDIQLVVTGNGFNEFSKIVFGGNDEPTTLLSPTQVRTIVKPSMFPNPDDNVSVAVRNGALMSNEQNFSFTASARMARSSKADDEERHTSRRK
jgi:hypothetical protein